MKFQISHALIGAAALYGSTSIAAGCCTNQDHEHYQQLVDNYFDIWGKGDVSLINQTFESELNVNIDSVPSSKRALLPPVKTSGDLGGFVQLFQKMGWKSKEFAVQRWLKTPEGDLVIRWQFTGVIGDNFTIPSSLKPGDVHSYNATDVLRLNPCSGLMQDVDMSIVLVS